MKNITLLFLFTISTIKIVSITNDDLLFSYTKPPKSTAQRLNIFKVIDKLSSPAILAESRSNQLFFSNLLNNLYKQDPNIFRAQNETGMTPVMYAIKKGEESFAFKLLEKYPQEALINATDQQGNTALHHAIKNKLFNLTCDLLRLGANINAQNNSGQTPLHLAFENQDAEIAHTLLLLRANPNIPDIQRRNALHILAQHLSNDNNKNIVLLELLIRLNADINAQDQSGFTPLHLTLIPTSKHYPLNTGFAKELLKHNANADLSDIQGNTPLHTAVLLHNPTTSYQEIIDELIPKTTLSLQNSFNETPNAINIKFNKNLRFHYPKQQGNFFRRPTTASSFFYQSPIPKRRLLYPVNNNIPQKQEQKRINREDTPIVWKSELDSIEQISS